MDETEPYCDHPTSHYTATKVLAEKAVLAANGVLNIIEDF